MYVQYHRISDTIVQLFSALTSGLIALERNPSSLIRGDSKGMQCHCEWRFSMATFNLPYDGSDRSPLGLSAWERFIRSAGVSESGCASLVVDGTRKGDAIRSWVLANYATKYVPEHILELLGLRGQLVLRWHREERQGGFSITTGEARY